MTYTMQENLIGFFIWGIVIISIFLIWRLIVLMDNPDHVDEQEQEDMKK